MSEIIEKIKKLPDILALKPATQEEVFAAEKALKLAFSSDYKEYLLEFGAILAEGTELTGIAQSAHRHVVAVTKQAWDLNPLVSQEFYVVENTAVDGIVIWQDSTSTVYKSAPNTVASKIASSLSSYLEYKT